MKKFVVKPRTKETTSFRPYVETLECRAQPGSVLGLGSSLLGAAALDLNSAADQGAQRQELPALVSEAHLARDNELALQVHYNGLEASQGHETAPLQITPATSAPVQTSAQSDLSIQDQSHSIAAHSAQTATTAHPSVTLTQAPVSSQARLNVQGQTLNQSQNSGNSYQASALALSAEGLGTTHAAVSSQGLSVHTLSNLTVSVLGNNHTPPPGFTINPIYISYLGTADGNAHVNGIRANPAGDGTAFVTGDLTDPNTGASDAYLGQISSDGSSISPLVLIGTSDGSANVTGKAVDVGQDGSIYIVGAAVATDGSGTSQGFIARVESDVATVDWVVSVSLGGTTDTFNGVRDATDPNIGEALYVTGAFGDPNTGNADLAILEISNLQSDFTQLQLAGGGFAFQDPNGNPSNSVGNGISVDANGTAFVATTYGLTDNSDTTALLAASPSGISTASALYLLFSTTGPTNGSFNSVDVDPTSNIAYFTGTFGNNLDGHGQHQSLVAAAYSFDPGSSTFTSAYTSAGMDAIWVWSLGNGTTDIDWSGTGNKAIPGSGGDQAINSTGNDPANPGGINVLFRLGPNGDMSLDSGLIGVPGGSNDDQSTALDVQADPFGGNDYYMAGFTNSPDFATTANSFQPNDPDSSGTLYEGWVADLQITPM